MLITNVTKHRGGYVASVTCSKDYVHAGKVSLEPVVSTRSAEHADALMVEVGVEAGWWITPGTAVCKACIQMMLDLS